jgi:dCTP diphosphatase
VLDTKSIARTLRIFAEERNWDQYHTPRNLASALSVEAAELLEIYQWSRGQNWAELEDSSLKTRTEEEIADILIYLIRFSDKAGIDLQLAVEKKLLSNAEKYPADQFRGSDRKYTE